LFSFEKMPEPSFEPGAASPERMRRMRIGCRCLPANVQFVFKRDQTAEIIFVIVRLSLHPRAALRSMTNFKLHMENGK